MIHKPNVTTQAKTASKQWHGKHIIIAHLWSGHIYIDSAVYRYEQLLSSPTLQLNQALIYEHNEPQSSIWWAPCSRAINVIIRCTLGSLIRISHYSNVCMFGIQRSQARQTHEDNVSPAPFECGELYADQAKPCPLQTHRSYFSHSCACRWSLTVPVRECIHYIVFDVCVYGIAWQWPHGVIK